MGTALIQIPFKDLRLVVDVELLLIAHEIPSLISMRDMVRNGLEISILHAHVTRESRLEKLNFENYFLVHEWEPSDMPYTLYTETELRTIHRNFGHPCVRATRKPSPSDLTGAGREADETHHTRNLTLLRYMYENRRCPRRFQAYDWNGHL